MIVVDAAAAVSGLLRAGVARELLASQQLHVPHLVDSEVASGLRRLAATGQVEPAAAWVAVDAWRHLSMTRYPLYGLLERVWELRDNVSAYDAGCVAVAEALGCALVTADGRLSRAPGIRCTVTTVPQ